MSTYTILITKITKVTTHDRSYYSNNMSGNYIDNIVIYTKTHQI